MSAYAVLVPISSVSQARRAAAGSHTCCSVLLLLLLLLPLAAAAACWRAAKRSMSCFMMSDKSGHTQQGTQQGDGQVCYSCGMNTVTWLHVGKTHPAAVVHSPAQPTHLPHPRARRLWQTSAQPCAAGGCSLCSCTTDMVRVRQTKHLT